MALESAAQFIDDLVEANPAAGDPIAQGDDHIRLLKAVLRRCFPGLDEALLDAGGDIIASRLGNVPAVPTELVDDVITPAMLDADTDAKKLAMRTRVGLPIRPIRVYNSDIDLPSVSTWSSEQTADAALTGRSVIFFQWTGRDVPTDPKVTTVYTLFGQAWDAAVAVSAGSFTDDTSIFATPWKHVDTVYFGRGNGTDKFRVAATDDDLDPMPLEIWVL